MTTQEWIEQNHLKCALREAPHNPHMRGMPDGSRHWLATFTTVAKSGAGNLIVYYSTGPGLTSWPNPLYGHPDKTIAISQTKRLRHPTGADVLSCVADDIASVEDHEDAIVMAVELGQTIESTADVDRAREVWNVIQAQRAGIIRLTSEDALSTLLYDVERD